MADFEEAGDDDVFRKIRKDFDAKGVAQSDHQIRRTMDGAAGAAVAQIKAGRCAAELSSEMALPALARRLLARAKPSTPAGAACRADRRRIDRPRPAFRRSRSTSSTASTHGHDRRRDRGGAHGGAAPIVRVPLGDFAVVSRVLDFGAEGVIAPMINTAGGRARVRRGGEISAGRRAQLGPACAPLLPGYLDSERYLPRPTTTS